MEDKPEVTYVFNDETFKHILEKHLPDVLYKLIKKYKGKLQKHRNQDLTSIDMNIHVLAPLDEIEEINDEIDAENLREDLEKYKFPEVIAKDIMPVKMLTQEEAIMKLEFQGILF